MALKLRATSLDGARVKAALAGHMLRVAHTVGRTFEPKGDAVMASSLVADLLGEVWHG